MKPIHKYNGGAGATLCHQCRAIITTGLTEDIYCHRCGPNKTTYPNRYGDLIQFEHIDNKVIMTGGSWFRYGWPNVYDKAYEAFVNEYAEHGIELMDFETFKNEVHNSNNKEQYQKMRSYAELVYSDRDTIDMVDPSGGPYISLGDNLKDFFMRMDHNYQDLIITKIEMEYTKGEKPETIVTFTVNEKTKTT
jgi:hypothetical protein